MEANKILTADLLDLIFDDRNKAYGAYELRVTYEKRIKKSLLITGSIVLLVFTGTVLANNVKSKPIQKDDETIITLRSIEEQKPEALPEPIKPKPKPEQVRTEVFVEPQIAPDEEVVEPPVANDVLDNVRIDNVKQDGIEDDGPTRPDNIDKGTGILDAPKKDVEDEIFKTVEIEAKFNGDWRKFLERNLNGNVPVDNDAPVGWHTVRIQFIVDVDGTVSNIQPLTNLGFGMEQEAVRVLKKAAKWEPAFQNGTNVKAYRIQTITFEVTGDE